MRATHAATSRCLWACFIESFLSASKNPAG
jgi:hypothetical protein